MKKLILAAIVTITLFSCKKETSIEQPKPQYVRVFIQAVAVDYDGTETFSPIIVTR